MTRAQDQDCFALVAIGSTKQSKQLYYSNYCTQKTTERNKLDLVLFECRVPARRKKSSVSTFKAITVKTNVNKLTVHLQTLRKAVAASSLLLCSPYPELHLNSGKSDQ